MYLSYVSNDLTPFMQTHYSFQRKSKRRSSLGSMTLHPCRRAACVLGGTNSSLFRPTLGVSTARSRCVPHQVIVDAKLIDSARLLNRPIGRLMAVVLSRLNKPSSSRSTSRRLKPVKPTSSSKASPITLSTQATRYDYER